MAAELHLHLEGSVEPDTMRLLVPELSCEEIRVRYRFENFAGFIQCFKWVVQQLRSPEDYSLIAKHLLRRLERQGIDYAEITLSAGVILWRQLDFDAIWKALQQAAAASPVQVRWNLDAIRQFGADHAMRVAEIAAGYVGDGAISFGIGGDEKAGPAEIFADVYAFARGKGLRLTAHAGETMGPESVWAALKIGAERIGHGIRAIDDPELVKHLRDERIPLEICMTSNVATGAVSCLDGHPIRRLYDAGVPITINTDDPAIFGTMLAKEFEIARTRFGFTESELAGIAENAYAYRFS
ncbi:MAG: adenosine deaminase [Bryobacteraceae bacterium]